MEENIMNFDVELKGLAYTINDLSNTQIPAYLINTVGKKISDAINNLALIQKSIYDKVNPKTKEEPKEEPAGDEE